ncbi:aldose epimerase family protein [Inquilinus sp. OTU3971]|uniref:aldose epimerase family protein n=1 Tax=Inquilinus sp. OTU3971 TaxID=3043855 RepID=UPI00313F0CBA
MSIHPFGRLPDGRAVHEIRLANAAGATASVITFGAAVRDLVVPLGGGMRRVVLGFAALDGYLDNRRYLGVTAGRHASRIGEGRLVLDGTVHQLSRNDGRHHLHGGATGFSRRLWYIVEASESAVTLGLVSPDGEDGYPGRLDVRCTYRLEEPASLSVEMTATTDAPTIVSLAHHSYFTLAPGASIRGHRLWIPASRHVPFGPDLVPTGDLAPVAGTPYDFRTLRPIAGPDPSVLYDCCLVLDREGQRLQPAARLEPSDGGFRLEVATTEPCLVFYDGAGLGPDRPAVDGSWHFAHAGLCLEPMRYPDSPNQPAFPQAVLRPGELYRQQTTYAFIEP